MSDALPPNSSAEDYYQAGLAALEDWSTRRDALPLFQQAVALDPEHLDAWYELAKQQRETGDYTKSLDACDRILALDPDHSHAWACRAAALHDLQRNYGEAQGVERLTTRKLHYSEQEAWTSPAVSAALREPIAVQQALPWCS